MNTCIPNIIATMGKGAEAGGENLEELEEGGDLWPVCVQPIVIQRAVTTACILFRHLQCYITLHNSLWSHVFSHSIAVAGVAVHADALPFLAA